VSDSEAHLSLPPKRCLTRTQAADYLGIGVTLLIQIGPPSIRLGRRCLYDLVDLDRWLDEYKSRGRASKEDLWPVNEDSTKERTRRTGGLTSYSPMEAGYAEVLDLNGGKMPKNT
jgi:hypothetical protein